MSAEKPTFGVVVPFYNEVNFLEATLTSLAKQSQPADQYVLVDNGSTDGSRRIAESFCERISQSAPAIVVDEPTPGKVHAMHRGCPLVSQDWLVTCDADTYYPPHYLAKAAELALASAHKRENIVALMALGVPSDEGPERAALIHNRLQLAEQYPGKCFTGGFGQIFRTDIFNKVGGFDASIWPFVLMDHEIVHRMYAHGRGTYDADFWCIPSERRTNRTAVRWNILERMLYRNVPRFLEAPFFYRFLASRFSKRGLHHINLREQSWQASK